MYLNKKTSLSICRGFRDENRRIRHTTVKTLGLLENQKKEYNDPIAHIKEVIKKMNEEKNQKNNQ